MLFESSSSWDPSRYALELTLFHTERYSYYRDTGKWTCPTCQSASTYFTALDADALPKKRLILHTSDTRPTPSPPQNSKRSKSGETPRFSRNEKGKGRARENVYGDNVTPRSGTSGSGLKLTFNLGRPLKNAASVIKSRVSSVKRQRKEDEIPYWNRVASPEPEEEEDAVEEDLDPYGGILVGADAAIDDRRPTPDDRKRWEMSREVSEVSVAPTPSLCSSALFCSLSV